MSNSESVNKEHVSPLSLLKNWDFTAIFIGGFINNVGSFFTVIGIVFLALEFTNHLPENVATQEVALISTFSLIPMLLLGPIGGAIADRFDRKKILYLSDFLGAFAAFSLFFSTAIWHLYVFSIVNSAVRQFFYPAKQSSLPKIVKRDLLLSANGFIQSTQQLSRIIGPLVAGFVVAFFGLRIAFIIDGISYLISSVLIFSIRTDLRPIKNNDKRNVTIRHVFYDLRDGFRLVFNDTILRFILFIFFFTILAIGLLDPLIVPYLKIEFGLDEKAFGMLMSFSAISGIIAAIIISAKKTMRRKIFFMTNVIILLGLLTLVIGISPFLPFKVVWLYVGFSAIGIVNVGFNIPFSTLLQKIVLNKNLGKISGIIDTVLNAASLLASVTAVILSKFLSISIIFIIIAGVIIVAGIIGTTFTRVRHLDELAYQRELQLAEVLHSELKNDAEKKNEAKIIEFDRKLDIEATIDPTFVD